jgi:hypothetical protein
VAFVLSRLAGQVLPNRQPAGQRRVGDRFEIDRRLALVDQTVVDAKVGNSAEDDRLRLLLGLPVQAGKRRNRSGCGALAFFVADDTCSARCAGVWASIKLRPSTGNIAFNEPDIICHRG